MSNVKITYSPTTGDIEVTPESGADVSISIKLKDIPHDTSLGKLREVLHKILEDTEDKIIEDWRERHA